MRLFLTAIFCLLASLPARAQGASQSVSVSSCVGQISQIFTAGEPSGVVLSITNQTTKTGAVIFASDPNGSVTVLSANNGSFAVTVGVNWAPTLLAVASRAGYELTAYLRYHLNGSSFVVEDFRVVQGVSPQPDCH